jgi:hypothetical protein
LHQPSSFLDRREHFFEAARQAAQREYELDNTNAQVGFVSRLHKTVPPSWPANYQSLLWLQALVKWGGALLELAHYKPGKESVEMIEQVSCSSDLGSR